MMTTQPTARPLFPFQYPIGILMIGEDRRVARVRGLIGSTFKTETSADWNSAFDRLSKDRAKQTALMGGLTAVDADYNNDWQPADRLLKFRCPSIAVISALARQKIAGIVIITAPLDDPGAVAFCRSIADLGARILWVANEPLPAALTLLNERVAHAVLLERDPDLAQKLSPLLDQLSNEYFDYLTAPLQPLFNTGSTQFLVEPAAQQLVCEMRRKLGADEYYVTSDPPGVLLIGNEGATFLLIADRDFLRAHEEIAAQQSTIEHSSGAAQVSGFYEESAAFSWRDVAWASTTLHGARQLSYALVTEAYDNGHLFECFLGRKQMP